MTDTTTDQPVKSQSAKQRQTRAGRLAGHPLITDHAPPEPGWEDDAACVEHDPDLFFIDRGDDPRPAQEICAECPVVEDCLRHALTFPERFGIWGGMTGFDLRALRKLRNAYTKSTLINPKPTADPEPTEEDDEPEERTAEVVHFAAARHRLRQAS